MLETFSQLIPILQRKGTDESAGTDAGQGLFNSKSKIKMEN